MTIQALLSFFSTKREKHSHKLKFCPVSKILTSVCSPHRCPTLLTPPSTYNYTFSSLFKRGRSQERHFSLTGNTGGVGHLLQAPDRNNKPVLVQHAECVSAQISKICGSPPGLSFKTQHSCTHLHTFVAANQPIQNICHDSSYMSLTIDEEAAMSKCHHGPHKGRRLNNTETPQSRRTEGIKDQQSEI